MLANWVKETTATTGTGTISLGGAVSGHVPFSAQFSSGDMCLYSIADGNNREIGLGTLTSGSPWTLARTKVLQTLVSGTYDGAPSGGINLSGGATVSIDMARQAIDRDAMLAPILSGGFHVPYNVLSYNYSGKGGGEFTAQAGRIVLTPLILPVLTRFESLGAHLNTASAGGNFRIGLYSAKRNGAPDALLADSGNISTASTGAVFASLASVLWLPAGYYYLADCVDNTTATAYGARSSNSLSVFGSRYGSDTTQVASKKPYYDQSYGALPASIGSVTGTLQWASFGGLWK